MKMFLTSGPNGRLVAINPLHISYVAETGGIVGIDLCSEIGINRSIMLVAAAGRDIVAAIEAATNEGPRSSVSGGNREPATPYRSIPEATDEDRARFGTPLNG